MNRKSSVHFKAVSNVRFAVSHSERTDLSEPEYLLPKEHQLGNVVVAGSLSENELSVLFIQQKERMTGQAKARGSSPFWEGVVVLSDTDEKAQSAKLQDWKVAYEQATGHKVLHMSVHLDEGYIDATGHPQYNPHAHVIVSRMDDKNKVISLDRKQMAAVQDLTSETLEMQRGSTLAERGGKRGRRHVGHREYRAQADEARLDLDSEKGRTALEGRLTDTLKQILGNTKNKLKEAQAQADKVPQLEAKISTQAAEIARINEQYRLDREALKASDEATQRDYQALKIAYNKALEDLTTTNARATKMDAYSERLKVDLAKSNEQVAAALREKAEAIEALVKSGEKSQGLLETAKGYRDDAAKIQKIAADFRAENLLLKAEIVKVKAKFETLAKTHQEEAAEAKEQASKLRQLKAEYAEYREGAIATAAASASKPVPAIQQPPQDVSLKARKAAQEGPKQSEASDPSPKAEKPLIARLVESLNAMLDWITGNSGKRIEINTQHSDNYGPVVQLDDLHAVQRTGRGLFVIHQLTHLDNIPALDDPKMEIKYRDGVGHVGGQLGKSGVQI